MEQFESLVNDKSNMNNPIKKLILIGNGFDLAHGLKTSYRDFLNWYICNAYNTCIKNNSYNDLLIDFNDKIHYSVVRNFKESQNSDDVFDWIAKGHFAINYKSFFLKKLVDEYQKDNWVSIERYYFRKLISVFKNSSINNKTEQVIALNKDFDFIIRKLSEYLQIINNQLENTPSINLENSNLFELFKNKNNRKFLNFNYTDTLYKKGYAFKDEIINIHGEVSDLNNNPIIFGYGDESDPFYQNIEDSGENFYLEHIKSFGYFRTDNYQKLLSYVDSEQFEVYVIGHSCGLSDRVLLNEIFEHENCKSIEIFYHLRKDQADNFKEITQEISRHFKPQNKKLLRRKIKNKNPKNIIPQITYS